MTDSLKSIPFQKITLLWLAWAIIILGFQNVVQARFQPSRPDRVLFWTDTQTRRFSQNNKPYLIDPFMNEQVSWDSEYYISVSLYGYDDPEQRTKEHNGVEYALNYAFFPLYPMVMRVVGWPLQVLSLTPVARATLAGVIISLLGTLAGMIALYDIAHKELGDEGAMRAVFYLLIFPTGFFLAQVYTEGLFIGLAFSSLALMQYSKKSIWYMVGAAVLAALATLTRAVGGALVIALFVRCLADEPEGYRFTVCPFPREAALKGVALSLIPVGTYMVWASSRLGAGFRFVEQYFFGRGTLRIIGSMYSMGLAWQSMMGDTTRLSGDVASQTSVYFAIEFIAIGLGLLACVRTFRDYPDVAAFSTFAWAIAVFSGHPQSQVRYMLVLPSIFIFLGRLGRRPVFDRVWTIISVLLMGLLAALFSFDFWVA